MKKFLAVSGVALPSLNGSFDTFILPRDGLLSLPVQSHADMIFTVFHSKIFFHRSYYETNTEAVEFISSYGGLKVCITDDERGCKYPLDVSLNTLTVDNRLLCRKRSVSRMLRDYPIIDTNQGYAGCTALYAGGTVVTADASTISSCIQNGIPYFRISGDDILLPGYDTGFIGGACGVYKDTVYIYGDPTCSRSGRELAEFCEGKGLALCSLNNGPVTDIGGIKFIEKKPE